MALFKPFRGARASLPQELHDGYAYFCTDDGTFHIDYTDADGHLQRKQINAKDAETLTGMTLDEIKAYVAVQSDWSQNDSTAMDYIKNRPFGDQINTADISGSTYTIDGFTSEELTITHTPIPLELGQVWSVQTDTEASARTLSVQQSEDGELYLGTLTVNNVPYCIKSTETTLNSSYWVQMQPSYLTLTCVSGVVTTTTVKQLSQKYIPNADWSVNDENADGYIKNRTHFVHETSGEIFPETHLKKPIDSSSMTLNGVDVDIVAGKEYSIKWNGENYTCTSVEFTNNGITGILIGNVDFVMGTGDSGEPFVVSIIPNNFVTNDIEKASVVPLDDSTEATIAVSGPYYVYHQLDEKYIPDTIARVEDILAQAQSDWNQVDNTASDYIKNRPFYSEVVNNTYDLTIDEQSSDGGTSTDATFAKLLYENYTNCVYEVFNGNAWHVGNIDSVETTDAYLVIEISCPLESGNTLGHTVKIAHDYSSINWVRATELSGSKIRFTVTIADETVHQIEQKYIPNTIATKDYVQSFLPKSTTVTLPAANWTGDANPWSQVVTINGATENSKLDLLPSSLQIVSLQSEEISLMLQNDAGVVTAWAIGNKPTEDYTMQVLITEVVML